MKGGVTTAAIDPERFWQLPTPWVGPRASSGQGELVVVFDDDPTGTQTVHDVPVVLAFDQASLSGALQHAERLLFISTNLRALTAEEACARLRSILHTMMPLLKGRTVSLVSRGDSTLRGHFPLDVQLLGHALAELGQYVHSTLLVPAFIEGGRFTYEGAQFVADGDGLTLAANTPYAQDATFGYSAKDLPAWVAEKTGGAVAPENVAVLRLPLLRAGGPLAVAQFLRTHPGYVAVDAVSHRDLEVLVDGLRAAEAQGLHFVVRSAASYVAVRAELAPKPLLSRSELGALGPRGLWVIGSHVANTTAQAVALRAQQPDLAWYELPDPTLGDAAAPAKIAQLLDQQLRSNRPCVLITPRQLHPGRDGADSLAISRAVSDALAAVVAHLQVPPHYIVTKGGITSFDIAVKGCGISHAWVLGQIRPGVTVWRVEHAQRGWHHLQIVFPGNVGTPSDLSALYQLLQP